MTFAWSKITKPVFILAPMANITTLPFRSICKEMGADIVFTPMLSSNAIVYNLNETYKIAEFLPVEQPVIVQIFGYDGDIMVEAANMIDKKLHPAGIDINLGCPAPKITGNECGSGLLRDYDKALGIVKKVRDGYNGQLSVKLRLGWRDYDVLPFIQKLQEIGIDAISIHGRTTKQGYSGNAEWDKIEEIANAINIPVIGNGDITTAEQAWKHLEDTRCHLVGVMIGRGALGNPWIFRDIKQYVHPLSSLVANPGISCGSSEGDPRFRKDDMGELKRIILDQTLRTIDYLGNEEKAMREMRKHYGWYLKDFTGAKQVRVRAMTVGTLDELKSVLKDLK